MTIQHTLDNYAPTAHYQEAFDQQEQRSIEDLRYVAEAEARAVALGFENEDRGDEA